MVGDVGPGHCQLDLVATGTVSSQQESCNAIRSGSMTKEEDALPGAFQGALQRLLLAFGVVAALRREFIGRMSPKDDVGDCLCGLRVASPLDAEYIVCIEEAG